MRRMFYLIVVLTLVFITQISQAHEFNYKKFNQFVVFGDSLSDNGNYSLINNIKVKGITGPPKFTTNPGNLAFGDIAIKLGFRPKPSFNITNPSNQKSIDYAVGAAGINHNGLPGPIPTISTQVGNYLKTFSGQANQNALYNLWGGANDIVYHATQQRKNIETMIQAKNAVINSAETEVNLINTLERHGVRHIIVFNQYDLGKTPFGVKEGPARQKILSDFSNTFNNKLNTSLAGKSGIIPVDIYHLTKEIQNNPERYGFKNVTKSACDGGSLVCGPQGSGTPYSYAPGTQNAYFFAFSVHPTTGAHAAFAQAALSELDAPGQISLLGEAPIASSNSQLRSLSQSIHNNSRDKNNQVFMHVGYTHQTMNSSSNSPGVDSDNENLTIGYNHPVTRDFSLGVAFGGGRASASVRDGLGGYYMTAISGMGFVAYHNQGNYASVKIGYSHLSFNDVKRRFPIRDAVRVESGNTNGNQIYGSITAGHSFRLTQHIKSGPFGKIEWQHIRVNSYNENGNDSNTMRFGGIKHDSTIFSLGWNLHGTFDVSNHQIHPYADLAWHHNTQTHPISVTAGLKNMNGNFALPGYRPTSNWGTADAGVSVDILKDMDGWIDYHRRIADKNQTVDSINLGLRIDF